MARRTTVISSHMSGKRDSWWYLVQDDDGALYVEHENNDDPEQGRARWPINEALMKGVASTELQALVGRMFEDRDA